MNKLLLKQNLYHQIDRDDILERQRFTLFRIFSLSGALVSTGVFLKMCFTFSDIKLIHYVLPALSVVMLLNFYLLKSTKELRRAYYVVLTACFILLHVVSYSTGGIRTASSLYYPVIIFLAFMLLGKRAGIGFTISFGVQAIYIFIISRFTNYTSFAFLNNDPAHIEEDFLFNILFAAFLIAAQSLYYFSGRNIVIQKITEQRDQLEKNNTLLQETNIELNKTNKELDKFVYSVSHDLRAPLSSMLGLVLLTEDDVQDEQVKQNLGLMKGSIFKLDAFIQDILAYSRNSRAEINKTSLQLAPLLDEICANLKYMGSEQRKVQIVTHVLQGSDFVSDKSRISIILSNLVANAIRYNNPKVDNPFVKIDIHADEKQAEFIITDNGIGISKEYHQKIFEMFFRVSDASIGSGLGLYLVKETVKRLGGTISLVSEPGAGTTFKVSIPNLYLQK